MKIFKQGMKHSLLDGEEYKINFIDEQDTFVGFDYEGICCEDFGYFLSYDENEPCYSEDTGYKSPNPEEFELEGYLFDKDFHKIFEDFLSGDGKQTCFRLVKEDCKDIYLHLYNVHNGYYAHGFSMSVGNTELLKGYL